jgi:hypothetical protein
MVSHINFALNLVSPGMFKLLKNLILLPLLGNIPPIIRARLGLRKILAIPRHRLPRRQLVDGGGHGVHCDLRQRVNIQGLKLAHFLLQ